MSPQNEQEVQELHDNGTLYDVLMEDMQIITDTTSTPNTMSFVFPTWFHMYIAKEDQELAIVSKYATDLPINK